MKITPISGTHNKLCSQLRSLKLRAQREKSGLFLIEGVKLINEAFAKGVHVKDIVVSQSFLSSGLGSCNLNKLTSISVIEDGRFKELASTDTPVGIVAIGEIPEHSINEVFVGTSPLVVVLEAIQDPGNLGVLIRTAAASDATGIILTKGTVDPYNPKTVRASAGAVFSLPIVANISTEEARAATKEHNLVLLACDPTGKTPFWETDLTVPTALAFGNEGQGLSSGLLSQADKVVSIPMSKMSESLNVAVAAGVILFSAVQQRFYKT
ncbi:MAG: RNA methyltransferase [Candidatus Melainabacteria bacterium]|nr:RNA methyltransferase [Candidatus Melainabacteria bacterium]